MPSSLLNPQASNPEIQPQPSNVRVITVDINDWFEVKEASKELHRQIEKPAQPISFPPPFSSCLMAVLLDARLNQFNANFAALDKIFKGRKSEVLPAGVSLNETEPKEVLVKVREIKQYPIGKLFEQSLAAIRAKGAAKDQAVEETPAAQQSGPK